MKTIQEVSNNILDEVNRARAQWGTSFDEKNTLNDWAAYVNIYLGKATTISAPKDVVTRNLRKAAGLILSALYHAENDILMPRHYDGQKRPASLPELPL